MAERTPTGRTPLVLKNQDLSQRLSAVFADLSRDEDLQRRFIDSPADVIGRDVLGEAYTTQQASAAGKFLYGVLANEELQRWAREYKAANSGRELPPEERLEALASAFLKYGDATLVAGLLEVFGTRVVDLPGLTRASLIVKADSVAIGNWFIYKVAGRVFGDRGLIFPPMQVQRLAEQLVAQARQRR
jgi:hypothetical protein